MMYWSTTYFAFIYFSLRIICTQMKKMKIYEQTISTKHLMYGIIDVFAQLMASNELYQSIRDNQPKRHFEPTGQGAG